MKRSPTRTLGQFASARSGDKGNHANIGIVARNADDYDMLCRKLTATRVAEFFQQLGATRVERFELPAVWALNFLLYNALRGGASRSLSIDTQGKLLGTAILELELPADDHLDSSVGGSDEDSDATSITQLEPDPSLWIRKSADGTDD